MGRIAVGHAEWKMVETLTLLKKAESILNGDAHRLSQKPQFKYDSHAQQRAG
jgi:hypothetical protein